QWAGAPSGSIVEPRAQLSEGWLTRVVRGLNRYDARTNDFRQNAVNTYASAVVSAGKRYEGDIALNADGSNLEQVGLIEAYQTVLHRGETLSIDGAPPLRDAAVNDRLLDVASRIASQYMLLGNEAYADASDPTIGTTAGTDLFAFQNQLPSLLDEELALLRGVDDGKGAKPRYNRLEWNFTGDDDEGQPAYVSTYQIT